MAVRPRSHRGRGQHFLRSSKLAAELVRAARVQRDDLVLDLGAGTGMLTAELARQSRRVVAIEVDPDLADGLRRRLSKVDVLTADVLAMPWPCEEFKVVANPPFDGATALLRRLLDPRVPLISADLIVHWGLACKRAAVWPSTQLGVYWGAWFELTVTRRLPRCVFAPPPAVDAGVLHVVRRERPLVRVGDRRAYGSFLAKGYRDGVRAVVPWRLLKQSESELGFDRQAQPRDLDAWQWAGLYSRTVR